MGHPPHHHLRAALAVALGTGLLAAPLAATPAFASPDGTGLIINEAYLKGGSANAPFKSKFVELYNPTAAAVDLQAYSLQYRPATGTEAPSQALPLSGSIPAKGTFLISLKGNGTIGAELPTADLDLTGSALGPSGSTGTLYLAKGAEKLTLPLGSVTNHPQLVDLLGYGASNTFEGALAQTDGNNVPNSLGRTAHKDTDNNAADFVKSAKVTPTNSKGETAGNGDGGDGEPPVSEGTKTIAEIQGEGAESAFKEKTLTTKGLVTAAYADGGFNGYYLQTPGTGAGDPAGRKASDAIFVYSTDTAKDVKVGDYVEVTGTVNEYFGLTQITVAAGSLKPLSEKVDPVTPVKTAFPATDAAREPFEGMLVEPQGDFVITENYNTNFYGELGLAAGTAPLVNPTVKGLPGTEANQSVVEHNNAVRVGLDDGASVNFNNNANKSQPVPYLSTTAPARIGAKVTFTRPVVMDYRNNAWKFQPTQRLTPDNAAQVQPAHFENTRTPAPAAVGGDLRLASFNVLNYFTTLGKDLTGCQAYTDREGNKLTVSKGCNARGAWDQTSFQRQESKIVDAINALDANLVSLEEIENTKSVNGGDRDTAVKALVAALNADDSLKGGQWDYVRSPQGPGAIPADEDVIRTAFIFKKDTVAPQGESTILTGSTEFKNARQPLAQSFKATANGTTFLAIVNHLKSKGDSAGTASGDNADKKDGVGAYNGDRTRQATALVEFAKTTAAKAGTENVFLLGDFNSYAAENPVTTIVGAGYKDLGSTTGKQTYAFDGATGSLDYVFASASAQKLVTGVDKWNINSVESVALEYSRHNNNVVNLYAEGPYRSSDHDPIVVGLNTKAAPSTVKDINLLNINDFHGRIDANTVNFAGTVEQLKGQFPGSTAFVSAGDNIGASLFASSVQKDKPTLDVLNALGLSASATGNHEFDKGESDLTGRVKDAAKFSYLAANLTKDGKPLLDSYKIVELNGVKVGIIGAITQETPTLVSPGGIKGLAFGDPVDAVNKVADQLSDGNPANGEADVLVAEYHEGTSDGVSTNSTLEQALAKGGVFKKITEGTSPKVDVIFNGHTHAEYAWNAPVPGAAGETRPVLQTGSYGERIGQVVLKYDTTTGKTTTVTNHNVSRTKDAAADLVAKYPAVAEVDRITKAALDHAAKVGNEKIAVATAAITTAFREGKRDDRSAESTLGNLVADALVNKLAAPERGGAEIGVVNPGGLRADLDKGDITVAQANAVLPFLNNLWTTSLTGAQFKTVLEQQWQRDAAGNVPSRAYLQLGVSKNVSYTFDAERPEGDRITSITVNGAPIDPAREYRIGSFSFLLQGGDNFREFAKGKDTKDTGLVDSDVWIQYLKDNKPVSPDFARRAVQVKGLPTGEVKAGDTFTLSVKGLNLTSADSPQNTELAASFAPKAQAKQPARAAQAAPAALEAGQATVSDGAAELLVTVPESAAGSSSLTLVAQPSGTTVQLPVKVAAAVVEPTKPTDPTDPTKSTDPTTTSGPSGSSDPTDSTKSTDGTDGTDGDNGGGDANGEGSGANNGGAGDGDGLANTGASVAGWSLTGLAALLAGALGVILTRRRAGTHRG